MKESRIRLYIIIIKRVNCCRLFAALISVGWPISQPPRAEAFSRPSAQPVSTQRCVCVCVYRHKAEVSAYACAYACVVSSLCPVYFSSPATLRLPSTTLAILSQSTHTGRESVDQWSRVPTGTMVEQISPITAVMNATSVRSLQRTTPNPLSCPGSTLCVSSQSPRQVTCANHTYVGEAYHSGQSTSLTFPVPFFPGESWPTSGARPLPQTRPFWLNQPAARQRNKFSERTPWGSNPGLMNCLPSH